MTHQLHDPSSSLSSFASFQKRVLSYAPLAGKLAVTIGFVFVVVYFTLMGLKVSDGITKELELPDHVIRLEIVNASGDPSLSDKVVNALAAHPSTSFEIIVVSAREISRQTHAASFLIARDEPLEAARLLGKWLHLDESKLLFRPLEANTLDISVTLVLGSDFRNRKDFIDMIDMKGAA